MPTLVRFVIVMLKVLPVIEIGPCVMVQLVRAVPVGRGVKDGVDVGKGVKVSVGV